MPLNDHVLLLQLERAQEALADEVSGIDADHLADLDHDHDERYAYANHDHDDEYADVVHDHDYAESYHEHPTIEERLEYLEAGKGLEDIEERQTRQEARINDLEATVHNLTKILDRALFGEQR